MGHEVTNITLAIEATFRMGCMTGLIVVPVLLIVFALFSKGSR